MLNYGGARSFIAPFMMLLAVALLAGCSANQLPAQVNQGLAAVPSSPTDAPATTLPEPPMATTASPTDTPTGTPGNSAKASSDLSAISPSDTPSGAPSRKSHTSHNSSSSSTATPTTISKATATATATATAKATSTAAPAPTASSTMTAPSTASTYNFPLLPPGATLPSEAFCAAHVQKTSEARPANQTANQRVPTSAQLAGLSAWSASGGFDPRADQLRQQITGHFTGTTDEILQWVACKWGVPVDVVRAEAVIESNWQQAQLGDQTSTQSECPPGTWNGNSCYQSYGILQIMYQYNSSAWPMSRDDTAFSAEYTYGLIRACYEGWVTYLNGITPQSGYPSYKAGDLWGCIGRWYSGSWYDSGAINYISKVKAVENSKPWNSSGF
jgi:hypothetical protein